MKNMIRMAALFLLCCLLPDLTASAETASLPPPESYVIEGGQVDDTAREDLAAWLESLDRGTALPHSGGNEVLASTIVENARSLVGKYPYVYGGESPEEGGFDCTGLVWYVYNRMSGLNITLSQAGRSKAALAAAGEKIYDWDAFLPGDVIQFTYAHVAIYVGDGRVVHARTTGTLIQETDLNYNNVEYAVRYPGVVQSNAVASGSCGDGVSWSLQRDGVLKITGSGAMADYGEEAAVPWSAYRDRIFSVEMDETVTAVGDYAFFRCSNLWRVYAPGAETIGVVAFYDCGALTELMLSGSLRSIGRLAFSRCVGLTSFTLPEAVVSIGEQAFYECTGLDRVTFPENMEWIGDGAFENCSSLQSIVLPDGVTRIGDSVFCGCTALTDVVLGSNVTVIDEYAFFSCFRLTRVSLPGTVTEIGDGAFGGCSALSEVIYSGFAAQWAQLAENGIGTDNGALMNVEPVCTGVPDAPCVSFSLNDRVEVIVLEWETVGYADYYEIWRAVGDGAFKLAGKIEGTVYCDLEYAPGSEYFYMVRAVSGRTAGKWSDIFFVFQPLKLLAVPPV